ncbi:hypothetical protein M5K25_014084 [Dendrobium thyrsiflorum]|uniref:Uncharacterized protein n=1 Tax=Dendrobium thyrsiflorum TaxID=117978 RepID=A0ABD0UUT2_DENTH
MVLIHRKVVGDGGGEDRPMSCHCPDGHLCDQRNLQRNIQTPNEDRRKVSEGYRFVLGNRMQIHGQLQDRPSMNMGNSASKIKALDHGRQSPMLPLINAPESLVDVFGEVSMLASIRTADDAQSADLILVFQDSGLGQLEKARQNPVVALGDQSIGDRFAQEKQRGSNPSTSPLGFSRRKSKRTTETRLKPQESTKERAAAGLVTRTKTEAALCATCPDI